ncbi:MAG: M24 family metallopeptidase [Armatimonadota bacterium]
MPSNPADTPTNSPLATRLTTEHFSIPLAGQEITQGPPGQHSHPTYVLSGVNSSHAIGRPTHKVLQKGELVQLNIGARISGYSPSVGLPVCVGKMTPEMKDLVSFGLEAHAKTFELIKAGIPASQVVLKFMDYVKDRGYGEYLLYGPFYGKLNAAD